MLVLSRRPNEKIKIGEEIEITIVSISGDNIRIGIEAPKHVKILRSEVFDEVKEQNREALKSQLPNDFKILVQSLRNEK